MKYAVLDKDGNQIQWVNDETIKDLPGNAIELTDDEWDNRLKSTKISEAEKNITLKQQLINSRKFYLSQTDWHLMREIDTKKPCPEEIKNKRIQAWAEINEIQTAKTLTNLNKFNITF